LNASSGHLRSIFGRFYFKIRKIAIEVLLGLQIGLLNCLRDLWIVEVALAVR
jgi:hypothetical protein